MNKPKISVVTVCYNAVDTIEETMQSVLNQTYGNVEYIIIDGGSTDGTVDIIKKYTDRLAYWVSEPDKGIYDAMNKGIDAATGDYIYFLGGDDKLLDNGVFSLISTSMTNPYLTYYGNVILSSGKIYDGKFDKYKLIRKNICHQAIFYTRSILRINSYDTQYKCFADWELNLRLFKSGFEYIPITIAEFKVGGASFNGDPFFMSQRKKLVYKYLGYSGLLYYYIRVATANIIKKMLLRWA